MFPKERRKQILRILERDGYVTVEGLAEHFDIGLDSIRKDLKALDAAGKCKREYGGAVLVNHDSHTNTSLPSSSKPDPFTESEEDTKARREVARRAYVEINNGDVIFLDISKTCLYIAELLAQGDKRCIVTTNMIDITTTLANNPKITTLTTGGYLSMDKRGFTGPTTISMLEALMFEKAFISACAINVKNHAVMLDTLDEGVVKQRVLDNATYKFLLAENNKFNNTGGYRFASISDFTAVITNSTNKEILQAITATGTPALC